MKKIGILTCLNSNDVCTRAGCLSAFRERRDFFSGYPEDTILAAVMTCNGCKETNAKEPAEDEGFWKRQIGWSLKRSASSMSGYAV